MWSHIALPKIQYLTTQEAAKKLRTSKQMLLRYLRNGTLSVSPRLLGSKMLWIEAEIDDSLANSLYSATPKKSARKRPGRPTKASQMLAEASS